MRTYFITILSFLMLLACQNREKDAGSEALTDTVAQQPDTVHKGAQVLALDKQVLAALKNKDYESFAGFIHPAEGVNSQFIYFFRLFFRRYK